MATFALVPHRLRLQAAQLAGEVARRLESQGHSVRIPKGDAEATDLGAWGHPEISIARDVDLAISMGGDGTMLRTVDLFSGADVAVLGVNVGQLGYLTEIEPDDLDWALERFLAGTYSLEERMTLEVEVSMKARPAERLHAMNEVVLEKTISGHTVALAVSIGGRNFLNYVADGLIVATPTGSTAYNLSAHGPILSPRLDAIVLTPVSAHMLFDRALVLDPSETLRIAVSDGRAASAVVDGTVIGRLEPGDFIECRRGKSARLVSFGGRDFHTILKTKFGLRDR